VLGNKGLHKYFERQGSWVLLKKFFFPKKLLTLFLTIPIVLSGYIASGVAVALEVAAPAEMAAPVPVYAPHQGFEAGTGPFLRAAGPVEDFELLTEAEINRQFERMLDASDGPTANLIRDLLRRFPRFGMSFFRQPPTTFAPIESMPVTAGYLLGPGDRVNISLWGMVEHRFDITINRDGLAIVPHIGAIRLAGQTQDQAGRTLRAAFERYFTDFELNLSVEGLRSITIYVTGDVRSPGAYTVSPFATLINALLVSGGPSDSGTLRRIELRRRGQTIAVFDMYEFLLRGDKSNDIRLLPGDVVFVPPVGPLVGVAGEVRRPGVYELKTSTRVRDLLYLAGGISAQTFMGRIQYYTIQGGAYRVVFEGSVDGLADRLLSDGDILRLFPIMEAATVVRIEGPIGRPGIYGVVPGVTRVSELVSQAGGLLPMASGRGELTRVTPTPSGPRTTRFDIDLTAALRGDPTNNLVLEFNDYLLVHILPNWETQRLITLGGEFLRPGIYAVARGERLADVLRRSGGFTSQASLRGAFFTRRRVAEEQQRALNRMADQMEQDLLESMRGLAQHVAPAALEMELHRSRELIARLRSVDMPGRIIIRLDVPEAIENTPWNVELEDGDMLHIPARHSTIEVMGAVYAASSHIFNPNMTINDYINAAGGQLRDAHKRMVYLMKSDGSVIRLTRNTGMLADRRRWIAPRGFSATLEPGDAIVVPLKHTDRRSLEALKSAVEIIYRLAVSVGVLIRL